MTEQDIKVYVEEIIMNEFPWTDPDFAPNSESLCQKDDLEKLKIEDPNQLEKFKNLEWKRASECYKTPSIFEHGISANDVR